jgi:hypothetical protein
MKGRAGLPYRIATRRADLGESITEAMREVRRLYEVSLG